VSKWILIVLIILSSGAGYIAGVHSERACATVLSSSTERPLLFPVQNISQLNPEKSTQSSSVLGIYVDDVSVHQNSQLEHQFALHKIDVLKTEYDFSQRSSSFTRWFLSGQEAGVGFDIGSEMRRQFDAEQVDYFWADSAEELIYDAFVNEKILAGVAIKFAVCKTMQCQITISVMNRAHMSEVVLAIIDVFGGSGFSHIVVDDQSQRNETVFYISNSEKGFELD